MKATTSLLGDWQATLRQHRESIAKTSPVLAALPVDIPAATGQLIMAAGEGAAHAFVDDLLAVRVRAIALDTEFRFKRPSLRLKTGKDWYDIRSQLPIALSISAWVESYDDPADARVLRAVVDLRVPGVIAAVARLLRIRVPLVFHHLKAELFTFWALGLDPDLPVLYDTFLAAGAIHLGAHHRRAEGSGRDRDDPGAAVRDVQEKRARLLSLVGQCRHYGLRHRHEGDKDQMRARFLTLAEDVPIDAAMADYASSDAEATLALYAAQQPSVVRLGLSSHLHGTEFPFAVANARLQWNGVLLSLDRMHDLRAGCEQAALAQARVLARYRVTTPGSPVQFEKLMRRLGLDRHFVRRTAKGALSTEDDVLELLENLHPTIRAFRLHRRFSRIAADAWLSGVLEGADGRHHPEHHQLGAMTGRNTCTTPNLAGIGKAFRPIVVAPPGRALVELDFAQVEVAVCAAEYGDKPLITACNTGDVYSAMAQSFYRDTLSPAQLSMDVKVFKAARPELRDRMKTLVLGILYGLTAASIAVKFGTSPGAAEELLERFLALYPVTRNAMMDAVRFGLARGHALIISGLRRHLPEGTRSSSWARNSLRNTPVQGAAAVIFKQAVVALDREFRGTHAWLVLPVHDAVLIECPIGQVEDVAQRARFVMRHVLRSSYPELAGHVDVNAINTSCWNKGGDAQSLERFLENPESIVS